MLIPHILMFLYAIFCIDMNLKRICFVHDVSVVENPFILARESIEASLLY